jgi:membrane protein implicated in regulation of membrane protease activity
MGFYRQLDALMAVLAAIVVFVGCILILGIPVKISLLVSACVLLAGLVFGRRVAEIVTNIL